MATVAQKTLSEAQLAAFYSDALTEDQVRHFVALVPPRGRVVDVGGGCGHFARRVGEATGMAVSVLDTDPASIAACREHGVAAEIGDALNPPIRGGESVATFNLILHHLVAQTEAETRALQIRALAAWRGADYVFVNEYVYESPVFHDFAGRLIYTITSSALLSRVASAVSRLRMFRALRANTFGVGVRFRSDSSWRRIFRDAGYRVVGFAPGPHEHMPVVRRLLLIDRKRRDSYLLKPIAARAP